MNNFPIEPPTDLFSSGLLSPTSSLFDSQLNYVTEVTQMPVSQTHMNFFTGFRDDFSVSTGYDLLTSSLFAGYDTLTTSDYGMPTVGAGQTQVVGVEASANATSVSGTDGMVAFTSADTTMFAVSNTESSAVLSGARDEMQVVDGLVTPVPSNTVVAGDTSVAGTSVESYGAVQEVVEAQEVMNCDDDVPTINIAINNVVCAFNTKCYLNLRKIAQNGMNVEHKKSQGLVSMKLRKPSVTATIWANGKVTCTGSRSEDESHVAARKVARCLQRVGCKVRIANFRVVNVLGTCSFPWGIRIPEFSRKYPKVASYEPELHPGVTYRLVDPKATLKIFSTGSITITAPCVSNIERAVEHIYPLVHEFRRELVKATELLGQNLQLMPQSKHQFHNLLKKPMPCESNQKEKRGHLINTDSNGASSPDSDY